MTNNTVATLAPLSICLFVAVGCAPVEFLSDVPEELAAIADAILIDESTRTGLRAELGEPFAASADGTVEVFRAVSGHDITGVVWLGPAPPLFGRRDVIGYLMVRYDSDGIVREVANGFTAETEPEYDRDRGDRRDLVLSLPPYQFRALYVWPGYQESLVTSLPDQWPPLPPDQCRLLFVPHLSPLSSASERELYIDDNLLLTYQVKWLYQETSVKNWFIYQFLLPTGRHKAAIEIPVYKGDRFEAEWSCSQNQTIQLHDNVGFGRRPDRARWHSGYGPVGSLNVVSEADAELPHRKLVLFHSGLIQNLEEGE